MLRINQWIVALGFCLLGSSAFAVPADDLKATYQPIIERNPFGLRPPPPPPTNNVAAKPKEEKPKREIYMSGITSAYSGHPKEVYLIAKEMGPGSAKKEPEFYALREGIEQDGIKILEIDPAKRSVHASIDGADTTLTFESHGITNAAAIVPPKPGMALPGTPGVHPGGAPMPIPVPGSVTTPQPISNPGATPAPAYRQIPSRRIRSSNISVPTPGAYGGAPTPISAGVPSPGNPAVQNEDPAEQYLRMHLDRLAKEKQTGIEFPPLPIVQ